MPDQPDTTINGQYAVKTEKGHFTDALNQQGDQLDKLCEIVSSLESKLYPVMTPETDATVSPTGDVEPSSTAGQHTLQVRQQVSTVRSLQRRIAYLLDRIEL